MANIISDETIEYVGILAKLELSEEEKEQAKKDIQNGKHFSCFRCWQWENREESVDLM